MATRYHDGAAERHEVISHLDRFTQLRADLIAAQRVLGMASPMLLEVQDNPQPVELGIRSLFRTAVEKLTSGDKWRFPRVKSAVDWLLGNGAATEESIEKIRTESLDIARGVESPFSKTEEVLREIESARGMSRKEFRKNIREKLNLRKGQEATIVRTYAKRSYLEGQWATMNQGANKRRWPYVMYVATHDDRVRSHHLALDSRDSKVVAVVGSEFHRHMMSVASEWNCRCSMVPLTLAQVEKLGLRIEGES